MSALRLVGTLGLTLVAFAANSVICRLALSGGTIDAVSFTALRICSGAVLLAVLVRKPPQLSISACKSALMLFAYAACFSFAYLQLSAATGALLLFGAVQVTMFAGALIGGERPTALGWLGWLIAVGGLVYLVMPGLEAPSPTGAVLMFASGLAWGLYSLLGKNNSDPVYSTAQNFMLAAPMALTLVFVNGLKFEAEASGVALAVVSGTVTSALGYVLWYSVLRHLSSVAAATSQLMVPAIAAFGGVVVLSEPISARLVIASLATLGGVGVALYAKSALTAKAD